MNTKLILPGFSEKIGISFAFSFALIPAVQAENKEPKPNILWITIEDTSPQFVGFYGNKQVKTPNIDKLAREGVIFNNAFSSNPVSSASRCCIFTGINNGQLGTGNHRSNYSIPEFVKGFPEYLRNEGVYTSNNVKTDYNIANEKQMIAQSWNESSDKAGWWNKTDNQNFFSIFNFTDSHQSRTMTHPYDWYVEFVLNKLKPENITKAEDIEIPPIYRETNEMRKNFNRVYNSINLMDQNVGELLDRLKKDGLMENTIIIFFGDHGEAIPRGKSSSVGLSYHVPFFIWFPEKYKKLSPWKLGKSTNELICLEDMPPSMLSLKGIKVPDYMTGRPIIGKQRKSPKKYIFGSRNRIDESADLVRTATNGKFFYTREFFQSQPQLAIQKYADVSDIVRSIRKDYAEGKLNKDQSLICVRREVEHLYDLKNDPWELHNLAADPKYKKQLVAMRNATYQNLIADKDAHFLPEYEILNISNKTNVYDYLRTNQINIIEIIDVAYKATNPFTTLDELIELSKSTNQFIRYWAMVGIRNRADKKQVAEKILNPLLNDAYPPVAIEAAAVAWDNYKNEQAKEIFKVNILSNHLFASMHCLQLMAYMPEVSADMVDAVVELNKRVKNKTTGYPTDHNQTCGIDYVLYKHNGNPLFLDNMVKWTNPAYLHK
jgi:arylsulfatase A-like enzyme